ncbi:hydroperoxide reductase [Anaeramoeba ignava]|uniref:Hydroperoxide reductase n=1 Tax=Anaeramoeba ignava TaxID=1746090 RepID=A0A9Q0LVK7_ANAIG|nr:hydroperoxide reductase [Anaeramoeba ignava]
MQLKLNNVNKAALLRKIEEVKEKPQKSLMQTNLTFTFNPRAKLPISAKVYFENGSCHIPVDIPQILGGKERAPYPIDICNYALAAMHMKTFVNLCTFYNITLEKAKIRSYLHFDYGKLYGEKADKSTTTKFGFILSVFTKEPKEKIEKIHELTKQCSPAIYLAQNKIEIETETLITPNSKAEIKPKKHPLNGIDLEKVENFKEKSNESKDKIWPTILEGEWDCEGKTGHQFSARLFYGNGKYTDLFADERSFLGGESNAPSPVQYFLSSVSSCILVHFILLCTQKKIPIKTLLLETQIDKEFAAEFGLEAIPVIRNLSFHFEIDIDQDQSVCDELVRESLLRCPPVNMIVFSCSTENEIMVNQSFPQTFSFEKDKKCSMM